MLFGRIGDPVWHAKSIVICPDGPLWLVPFETLVNIAAEDGVRTASWGCQITRFHITPTLRVARQLRQISDKHTNTASSMLIVARQKFKNDPDLPSVADEIEALRACATKAGLKGRVLSGPDATKNEIARAIQDVDIVHIATHAFAPTDGSEPYFLVDDGLSGDARLTFSELTRQRFSARLVFLSACSTARGQFSVGEGMTSIARAFLVSGTQIVIGALWPIVSVESLRMAERFYAAWFSGATPATALALSKGEWPRSGDAFRSAAALQIYGDSEDPVRMQDLIEEMRGAW